MSSVKKSSDLKMPTTKNGDIDKRYTAPQYCKNDGTRDMRTKNTHERK